MEAPPGDREPGGLARGGATLPRDDRLGSFAAGEEAERGAEASWLMFGWSGDGER